MFKPAHRQQLATPHHVWKFSWQQTCMGGRVIFLEITNPLQELLSPPLLEHPHQRRAQGLVGIRGDLGHGSLGTLALLDIAASNLFELEVSCDIRGDQDIRQFAVGHQQLWNQVDVPVVNPAVFLPGLLSGADVAILLEQLQETNTKRKQRETTNM